MEQNFLILAIIATSIYFMKLAMVFLGADDEFLDLEHPGHFDDGFKILSIQTFIAFLVGAGWTGWGLLLNDCRPLWICLGTAVSGVLTVALSLSLIHGASGLRRKKRE